MIFLTKICKLIPLILLSGCASYKVPTTEVAHPETAQAPIYEIIPRHRSQIEWYDGGHWVTWALLGNDDGGVFGEDNPHPYSPHIPNKGRKAISWGIRNPLHNFCYYVIGSAHRQNSEYTLFELSPEKVGFFKYNPSGYRVFASRKGGVLLAFHGGKPFISLKIPYTPSFHGEFYLGWRYRGNFGMKFRPWTRTKKSAKMKQKHTQRQVFNGE